jgi:hypothetical protein
MIAVDEFARGYCCRRSETHRTSARRWCVSRALHKRSSARVANAYHGWVQVFLAGSKFTTGVVLDVDGGHQVRALLECAVSAHQHSRALVELLPGVILRSGHACSRNPDQVRQYALSNALYTRLQQEGIPAD